MTQLEEYRAQMDKLRARREEYKGRLRSASPASEREALRQKLRTYGTMIRELQEQIDHLDPPTERKARARKNRRLDIGAMSWDFFERSGTVWSDLDGHTWDQVEAGDPVELGASMEQLQQWMAEGSERLTDRQRLYLDAYYNQGLSLERIAQEYGVDKSTVSRVVKNGLDRMQAWVDSKRLIAGCADGHGGFDWTRYLSQVPALTDRQRQLMLLVLSKRPKTQEELADKLELKQSTVSRTLTRAGKTVQHLGARGEATTRPELRGWDQADKYSLCLQTGMPLYFYYRFCFRGETVGGVSRYNYELSRRKEAGVSAEEAARELGLKPKTVRSAYSRLKRLGVRAGRLPEPEGDTIGARLDPETYVRLQRLVTNQGSPREPSEVGRVGKGGAPE